MSTKAELKTSTSIPNDTRTELAKDVDDTFALTSKVQGQELRYVASLFHARNMVNLQQHIVNTTERGADNKLLSARAMMSRTLAVVSERFRDANDTKKIAALKKAQKAETDSGTANRLEIEIREQQASVASILRMFSGAVRMARYLELVSAYDVVIMRGNKLNYTTDTMVTIKKGDAPVKATKTYHTNLSRLRKAAATYLKDKGMLPADTAPSTSTPPANPEKAGANVNSVLGSMAVELAKLEGKARDNVRTSDQCEAAFLRLAGLMFTVKGSLNMHDVEVLFRTKMKDVTIEGKVIADTPKPELIKTPKANKTAAVS